MFRQNKALINLKLTEKVRSVANFLRFNLKLRTVIERKTKKRNSPLNPRGKSKKKSTGVHSQPKQNTSEKKHNLANGAQNDSLSYSVVEKKLS